MQNRISAELAFLECRDASSGRPAGTQRQRAFCTVQFLNQEPENGEKGAEDHRRQHRAAVGFQPLYRHLSRGVSIHLHSRPQPAQSMDARAKNLISCARSLFHVSECGRTDFSILYLGFTSALIRLQRITAFLRSCVVAFQRPIRGHEVSSSAHLVKLDVRKIKSASCVHFLD